VPAGNPIRVMVVDDQEDARFLLRVILGDHPDIEIVAEAPGARSALEALDEADPAVVVLDAVMPAVDGYQTANRIWAARPGQPILLCTAHVDEVVRERAAEAGIEHVIGKDEFERIPDAIRALARSQP